MPTDAVPTGLSIREEQVFRLVREGRIDSEIAVRLGTGTGDVKQTVAELVSKLGVKDRAGLLTWQPGAPPSSRVPWLDRLADRFGATAGGLVIFALIAGIGGIYLHRALSGDSEPVDLTEAIATITPVDPIGDSPLSILRDGVL